MSKQKINYGIDLGTTNSSIARVEDDGNIRVFQIGMSFIMPSCIHFPKNRPELVGLEAYNKLGNPKEEIRENTFTKFKIMMGTNRIYHCSHTNKSYTPEKLSAEVLKELKSWIRDDNVTSAVITVPAAFDQPQIEATQRAAELAGFEHCELLQEPIAASYAYFQSQKKVDGVWLVFDLGGGTFDAALVKMEDGIISVLDHEGDNFLGGSNMDSLIVDEVVIPHLEQNFSIQKILANEKRRKSFHRAWEYYAEQSKIKLSDKTAWDIAPDDPIFTDDSGDKIDTAIKLKRSELEKIISPIVDRAINISKDLMTRNNLSPSGLATVLMVGGCTYMPTIREKVKDEICPRINISIDPMTVVAKGAALYASTKTIPIEKQPRDYSKIQLTLGDVGTTVETEIALGIKVDKKKTKGTVPSKVFAEITRNDKLWTTGRIELEGGAGVVRLHLIENTTNGFSVQLFDESGGKLECEPNSISILQGIKLSQTPLPLDIGIFATEIKEMKGEELMVAILKKGTSIPAVHEKTFLAPKDLRPGNSSDVLKIIVLGGKAGTKLIRNTCMGKIIISGDNLPSLLPEGSEVKIKIRMDESRRIRVIAYLPYLDKTIDEVMDTGYTDSILSTEELASEIEAEKTRLEDIQNKTQQVGEFTGPDPNELEKTLTEIDDLNQKGCGDEARSKEVQNRLNEIAAKIDEIERSIKWPQVENELAEELDATEQAVDRYGKDRDEQILSQLRPEVEKTIELKNVKRANDVLNKLRQLKWNIWSDNLRWWAAILYNINESFDEIQWSDRSKAMSLVDKGSSLLASGQLSDEIKDIVRELWDLMPETGPGQVETKEPNTGIPIYRPKYE
ncbi:Hsp70 family protein [candidate division WOR-3 bacterium]|nr:Hsp70 family protein [candidate division WOR-3 bacterium]